ncbi:50S ribosomal protein L27 [Microgenomates group bacterium RIFCSPLOWO2_01_FULL_47_10]|nr:MAG: 50S ribosomal protein L27 [Microgenomates group bacterium RIFCSPLOWO2_01_FULL_47_10]
MSHVKAGGKTAQASPRAGKRLGVKLFGGQKAIPGNIIIRQRGSKVFPGAGVGMGRDHTLYALQEGIVTFFIRMGKKFVKLTN